MAFWPRLGVWLFACLLSASAQAQAKRGTPGSLLLFPEVDTRAGLFNLLTVTNTEPAASNLSSITLFFVDGSDCTTYDYSFVLGPNDTLTLLPNALVPWMSEGYFYVWATDSAGRAIVHNHLVGTSTILNGIETLEYTVEPVSFLGIGDGVFTDLDNDTRRDLDGIEYSMAPAEQLIPRFLGQGPNFTSKLVLVDLSGGASHQASVDFVVYNDNSQAFSATHQFSCWTKVDLLSISGTFSEIYLQTSAQDPTEILGWTAQESGWLRMDGDTLYGPSGLPVGTDPAVLCLLVDRHVTTATRTSVHPINIGGQANASLPSHDIPLPPPAGPPPATANGGR